jgi:hypothetical protein
MWVLGSIPVLMYPIGADDVPHPPSGFLLITDLSNFLLTDNTPLETAGS